LAVGEPFAVAARRESGWAVGVIRRVAYRLAQPLALLLALATLFFCLVRVSHAPAAVLAGAGASPAQVHAAAQAYRLDAPLIAQYLTFLGHAARFDFGFSPLHRAQAGQLVRERLPATLALAGVALALTSLVGISLGAWLGPRAGQVQHGWAFRLLLTVQSVPALVVGLILAYLLGLSTAGGGGVLSLALGAATLAWWLIPRVARLTASSVAASARQNWILTARTMGATSREVLWRHILPNALLAAMATAGVEIAFLLSGAVVVEWLFGWPGVGDLLASAIRAGDFPVIEAAVFGVGLVVYVAYLVVDLMLATADPRLRRPRPRGGVVPTGFVRRREGGSPPLSS
jgi:peptide/nickel transport system permease protein